MCRAVPDYIVVDECVVVDLSPMLGTSVDPEVSVARAMAVLVWGDLDREAQAFALAAMGGRVSNMVGRKPVAVDRGRLRQRL